MLLTNEKIDNGDRLLQAIGPRRGMWPIIAGNLHNFNARDWGTRDTFFQIPKS